MSCNFFLTNLMKELLVFPPKQAEYCKWLKKEVTELIKKKLLLQFNSLAGLKYLPRKKGRAH